MNPPLALLPFIQNMEAELRSFGVKELWLFGSAARGETPAHDLDFLVDFIAPPTLTGFMNLKFFLEERLGGSVDLHRKKTCPARFLQRIQPDLLHVA